MLAKLLVLGEKNSQKDLHIVLYDFGCLQPRTSLHTKNVKTYLNFYLGTSKLLACIYGV